MEKRMTKERKEAYVEVLEILKHMEEKSVKKLPIKLLEIFRKNASKEYSFTLDINKSLKEQKLKEETVNILAMLYINYWYKNEEERKEWLKKFHDNEVKFQEELKEKYSMENLFKKKS